MPIFDRIDKIVRIFLLILSVIVSPSGVVERTSEFFTAENAQDAEKTQKSLRTVRLSSPKSRCALQSGRGINIKGGGPPKSSRE
jgi:hypothetical protein